MTSICMCIYHHNHNISILDWDAQHILVADQNVQAADATFSETCRSHFTSSQSEPPSQQLNARTRLARAENLSHDATKDSISYLN